MRTYRQETVLRCVEMRLILEERSLGERALHGVAPSVELAREDGHLTRLNHRILLAFLLAANDGERAVPTNVVEGVDVAVAVLDQEEVIAGHLEANVFASLGEALQAERVRESCYSDKTMAHVRVADEKPFLAEDGSPFQLVDRIRTTPRRR